MENAEEILQILERFTKLKQKDIPKELDEYLAYVAKTGDTVFTWANIKHLFREKLIHVIKDFHDSTSNIDDLPQYPNVDPFNYETMKTALLERLELFNSAPFTIQRICELLTNPKKQYSRIDKYMRALEKNILVVSTIEPGRKQPESENGDSLDSVVISLEVNVDIEMENENIFNVDNQRQQNGSNETSSSAINNKFDAENNKTHDDVDLPSAKKPKLEIGEEKSSKNEINKNDKIDREENNGVVEKENDLKKETVSAKTKEQPEDENTDTPEEETTTTTEKSLEEETVSSEKLTKDEDKESIKIDKKDDEIVEKDENNIDKNDLDNGKSVTDATKKTDDEPTQEEEDKLLNVDDEGNNEDETKETQQNEDVTDEKQPIPNDINKNKATEENHDDTLKVETKIEKDVESKEEKSCEPIEDTEKKIELFSTDDVVDPSDKPKEDGKKSETDDIKNGEDAASKNVDVVAEEEKKEICPAITTTKDTVTEEDKQEKITEDMAVEEPSVIPESTTPTTTPTTTTLIEKIAEKIPTPEPLPSNITTIPESISDIEPTSVAVPVDQPMDDPNIAETPVDIDTTTAADTTPCVEMQPADTNAMATDDVKIDEKLDVAGMDVDDVSQGEAMDQ